MRAFRPATLAASLAFCTAFAAQAHARLLIDQVDTSAFAGSGLLRFFVELTDDDTGQPEVPATAKLYVDNKPVDVAPNFTTATAIKAPIAVAFIVPSTPVLNTAPDPEQGLNVNPAREAAKGYQGALASLGKADRSTVISYRAGGVDVLAPLSANHAANAKATVPTAVAESNVGSSFYAALEKALDVLTADASLPSRRAIVVVSDALDADMFDDQKIQARITAVVERARAAGVRVYALGFTLAMPEPLVNLESLARQTGGSYALIPFEGAGTIAARTKALATHVIDQAVIEFKMPAGWSPAKPTATIRLEAAAAGKPSAKRGLEGIAIPQRH